MSSPCPACGARDTIRVTLTLAGAPACFTTCPNCEWKGWEREGRSVTLRSVLGLATTR